MQAIQNIEQKELADVLEQTSKESLLSQLAIPDLFDQPPCPHGAAEGVPPMQSQMAVDLFVVRPVQVLLSDDHDTLEDLLGAHANDGAADGPDFLDS